MVGRSNRSGRAEITGEKQRFGGSGESTESTEIADVRYKTGTAVSGVDPVEEAVATALERASAEQWWDAVSLLRCGFEARRLGRSTGNVVPLHTGVREGGER